MRHTFALAVVVALATAGAQPKRPNLTGTVVAVKQQSDTVTLIDLKTMEA